nr:hypothetical protein [uncultured bacterium]
MPSAAFGRAARGQEIVPDERRHRPCCIGPADARRLPRLQRHSVCSHRRHGCGAAHRPVRGGAGVHRHLHGEDGRLHQALFPGIPARCGVRQADRNVRLLALHRRRGDPPARHQPGDAGDRAGLRAAHLRRRVVVRRGVCRVPVRRRDVPPEQHAQAAHPGDHRPRRIHLHHDCHSRHAADPEHHPHHLLQHHHLGGALARPDRHPLRIRPRHALSQVAARQGNGRWRRLRHQPAQRAGDAGRHRPAQHPGWRCRR